MQVTGAIGRAARFVPIPIDRVRVVDRQLATVFTFFDEHSARPRDIAALRSHHPDLMDLGTWLKVTGWTP